MWARSLTRCTARLHTAASPTSLVPPSGRRACRFYATVPSGQSASRRAVRRHGGRPRDGSETSSDRRNDSAKAPRDDPSAPTSSAVATWESRLGTGSTLSLLLGLLGRGLHTPATELYTALAAGSPHARHLVYDMCNGSVIDAHDAVIHWMRAFTAIGRMDKVREVFAHALRDLRATDEQADGALGAVDTPLAYGTYVRHDDSSAACSSAPRAHIQLDDALLDTVGQPSTVSQPRHGAGARVPVAYPSQLRHSLFNAYLEILTRRTRFDRAEVIFILQKMEEAGLEPNALTYNYLTELHIRAGLNPEGLWHELYHERRLRPLPATVQALLLRVVPYTTNGTFIIEVTREALRCGASVMDKKLIAETAERWMRVHNSNTSTATTSTGSGGATATNESAASALVFPPEYVLWLLHELELRCLQDKASFVQYVNKQHMAVLLLSCAKCADMETAEKVMALMDRHAVPKTADVLALLVWCATQAGQVEKAFDVVEVMARKGYLELTDPLRRYVVECLRYTMDKHFLVLLAEGLTAVPVLERALTHLLNRRQQGLLTSVHSLDVVVLAAARLGEERRAMQLVSTYVSHWHVQPRTNTFNCLLVGNNSHHGTVLHRMIYEAMRRAAVSPNAQTFRVLIRQAVLSDNIDEAVAYLQEVATHPGLRVEVEMVLPIIERAARVGDVETVNRVSQFSLDCDVGIDGAVMGNVMKHLTDAGQSVAVVKGHLPLHEALRSRSKAGRQRARHALVL